MEAILWRHTFFNIFGIFDVMKLKKKKIFYLSENQNRILLSLVVDVQETYF